MLSKKNDDLCVSTRQIIFMTKWSNGSHSRPILLQFNVAGRLLIVYHSMVPYSHVSREGCHWRSLRGPVKMRQSDKSPIVNTGNTSDMFWISMYFCICNQTTSIVLFSHHDSQW